MLHITTTYKNADKGWIFGEDPLCETEHETTGTLYKSLVKEFGRCIGAMYIGAKDHGTFKKIGWIFVKRVKYDDSNETFLQESWVEVLTEKPEVIVRKTHPKFS